MSKHCWGGKREPRTDLEKEIFRNLLCHMTGFLGLPNPSEQHGAVCVNLEACLLISMNHV